MTKIAFVLGTRPEIIKMFSCIRYCEVNSIDHFVVNTDQHYDPSMRDVFFEELGIRPPKYALGVGSGSHSRMLSSMLPALEDVFLKEKPDVVLVQGDTNTVLAGALVACKMGIKVGHIEAGLRSYDRTMPEEYNRIIVDHVSDYLFAPTQKQADILIKENIEKNDVYVTGNTVVDAVESIAQQEDQATDERYILLTCHRPSNTDSNENLSAILQAANDIAEELSAVCIFPVHPRLGSKKDFIASFKNIRQVEPMKYSELLRHIKGAQLVLTDSGGIQEEACILERKCVILRSNTERPETIEVGGAVLVDPITTGTIKQCYALLKDKKIVWRNPFGDGKAAERIIEILRKKK